jgi:hypothetical protein
MEPAVLRLRTTFLLLSLLLAACAAPGARVTPTAIVSGPSALSIAVASNDFPTGQPRIPIVLFIGSQPIADAKAVSLTAFDLSSGTPVPGWSGQATPYTDYDTPYWVVTPALPTPGYWGLAAVVTLADGTAMQGQFTVEALADPSAPVVGEVPPAIENRTVATQPDLAKLTSDIQPERGLYEMTIKDAMASGRPSVVIFATPGFCTSRLCAPVLDSAKALYPEWKDRVNFIHIEIYQSFDPLTYGPEMDQWHLTSEPWTFVLDRQGAVGARFGGPLSPRELSAALAEVAAP